MATYNGPVRAMPGVMRLARDFVNGFYETGTIADVVLTQTAPGVEVPTHCQVILLRETDWVPVRATMSDRVTGAYSFSGIDKHLAYTVLAVHPTSSFRAVLANGLYPS